jgi:hypothetical protein
MLANSKRIEVERAGGSCTALEWNVIEHVRLKFARLVYLLFRSKWQRNWKLIPHSDSRVLETNQEWRCKIPLCPKHIRSTSLHICTYIQQNANPAIAAPVHPNAVIYTLFCTPAEFNMHSWWLAMHSSWVWPKKTLHPNVVTCTLSTPAEFIMHSSQGVGNALELGLTQKPTPECSNDHLKHTPAEFIMPSSQGVGNALELGLTQKPTPECSNDHLKHTRGMYHALTVVRNALWVLTKITNTPKLSKF